METKRVSMLIELRDEPGALEAALRVFSNFKINLTHIESRPVKQGRFDFYVDCEGCLEDSKIGAVIKVLETEAEKLLVLNSRTVPWFPRDIGELDQIASNTLDAGSDLESDHPGFNDKEYRQRRAYIKQLAIDDRFGDEFPIVQYTAEENATWRATYSDLKALHKKHACREYQSAMEGLESSCGFGDQIIPQCKEVSRFLEARTGFRLRPVAGLLGSRDFLNGLAFRVFFSTQYIRHSSRPEYTPEPDICHELIGHAPMFADVAFAEMSQEIGLASLGASDAEIELLARCYWHSVEFGLVREGGELKAYGAGLLSSPGEIRYALESGQPEYRHWSAEEASEQVFPITDYQPVYFVADSILEGKEKIRLFAKGLQRPFYARYNAMTKRIWVDRAVQRKALE